jgi:hypothetical protein
MFIIVLKWTLGAVLVVAMLIFSLMLILTDEFKKETFIKWTKWSVIVSLITIVLLFLLEWAIVKYDLPNFVL